MKKLIINLLCAEIVRLQKLVAIERNEALAQKDCGKNAFGMLESENMQLKAENKELRDYKEANTVSVKLDTKQVDELLQEAKNNVFALKDKNERLEKWDKEHREKIVELEKENETLKQTISEKDAIIKESSKKWQSAAWQILIAKTDKVPQWKNSETDGMPVFDSDPVAVITICGGIMATHNTLEEEDMEAINNLDDDFYYFLIPRVNATN